MQFNLINNGDLKFANLKILTGNKLPDPVAGKALKNMSCPIITFWFDLLKNMDLNKTNIEVNYKC